MKFILPIFLLVVSNIFMTLAWYGHAKLAQMKVLSDATPLIIIILLSWGLAFFEYCFMIPANKLGLQATGGPYSLFQMKIIQEVITLIIFTVFTRLCFGNETLHWNHLAAFLCLFMAVFFVFYKS